MGADLAGRALAAGVGGEEGHVLRGLAQDAGALPDHDHRAGAEPGAAGLEAVEVERRVEVAIGQQGVGRPAGEHGLEPLAGQHAAAAAEDQFAQRGAHRQFVQAGAQHVPRERVQLGSDRSPQAQRAVPVGAVAQDVGDVSERLHVVQQRRGAVDAPFGRVGRLQRGEREAAHHVGHRRGLLAADVQPGTPAHLQPHRLAHQRRHLIQQRVHAPRGRGQSQRHHRLVLARVDVQRDLVGAHRHRGDQRALDHLVRGAGEQEAVLERAGLVLVPVADDPLAATLGVRRLGGHRGPLAVGGEAGAAEAAQAGGLKRRHDRVRIGEGVPQPFPAAGGEPGGQVGDDVDPWSRPPGRAAHRVFLPGTVRVQRVPTG